MKFQLPSRKTRLRWYRAAILGALAVAGNVSAGDTNAPPVLTPQQFFEGGEKSYDNWVDFSAGSFGITGNLPCSSSRTRLPRAPLAASRIFTINRTSPRTPRFLSTDGRCSTITITNSNWTWSATKLGFLILSLQSTYLVQWRWRLLPADGPIGIRFGTKLSRWIAGSFLWKAACDCKMITCPDITFKYTHDFRYEGDQGSTSWGGNAPRRRCDPGTQPVLSMTSTERDDTFQLDINPSHQDDRIRRSAFTYETSKLEDALKIDQYPGEPVEQKITDQQNTSSDVLSVHAFSETWFKKNLMLSSGFSYSDMDNHLFRQPYLRFRFRCRLCTKRPGRRAATYEPGWRYALCM